NLNGSARFRAMGGAFGAVGGDLSAINVNPAGSSIFNNNQATFSLTSFNSTNTSTYFGRSAKATNSLLDINQIGAVFVFNDYSKKQGWNKFTLGLNYENTNNLNNYIVSEGTNATNSMGAYFLNKAQGVDVSYLALQSGETINDLYSYLGEEGLFNAQQAMLGYQAYMFDEDTSTSATNDYWTNIPTGGNYYQRNSISSKGYNGKFTANFSGAYEDKLYLGMNLNFMFSDYTRKSSLFESNTNPAYTTGSTVRAARFDNQLYTYGSGFSINLGAIYKVQKNARIGLSYESPTWYRFTDELTQRLQTETSNNNVIYTDDINPNVVNIYPAYKIQSPSKVTGSLAYIFGKSGLLSVDYTYKNYENTKFKPKNDELYSALNNQMRTVLSSTYELRIGGEYKIKQWSLRGGYRFEQSPFKNKTTIGDLTSYSGGLGYNFGDSRLDVSYTTSKRSSTEALLTSGLNDRAAINNLNNNVTLTYVINF
ncbi:MAG: hypothetical protein RLY43_91, partial [Bacteroidota bacterium]